MDAAAKKRYLQEQLEELQALRAALEDQAPRGAYRSGSKFKREWDERRGAWKEKTGKLLGRLYGPDSKEMEAFGGVLSGAWSGVGPNPDDWLRRLPQWENQLKALIWELEEFPESGIAAERRTARPKIFIAHSGETSALSRLERFLRALGVDPQVAEWLPYSGAQVPDHVKNVYEDCQCAVVFAEATEKVGDRAQPGRGALIEVGLLQEHFGDRVVYLREEGVELGPMADTFAAEFFTQDCLERAFYRLAVEFKNWGLI